MSNGSAKKTIKINMVSESVYGFQGQGVHTAFVNFVGMLQGRKGVEVLINSRQPCDILHAHTLGPLYWTLMRNYKGRRLMSAHVVPASIEGSLFGWQVWGGLFNRYMVAAYNSADAVIAVAPAVKRCLKEIGVHARQEVITNPVDLKSFRPSEVLRQQGRRKLGFKNRDRMALCVGQIQPRKGVEDFLEAARKNPGIQFVWVGGRPFSVLTEDYLGLNRKIKEAPGNVHFKGVFELEEMPAIYNAADVFLFPSFQENCALAIGEAAACGLPLLLRDLPDYRELYGQSFLAAGDGREFDQQLKKVFSRKAVAAHCGQKSLKLASAFASKALADRLLGIYRELLKDASAF